MIQDHVRELIRTRPRLRRTVGLALKRFRAAGSGYPDWAGILARSGGHWEAARAASVGGPKVLLATSVGGYLDGVGLESLLAVALTLRGADVEVLLCDQLLPACLACDVTWYPRQQQFVRFGPSHDLCGTCFEPGSAVFQSLGLRVRRYSEFLSDEDRQTAQAIARSLPLAQIPAFRWGNVAAGEHAHAGALRYFARASLDGEPFAEPTLRRYLQAALLTTFVTQNLLRRERYECLTFHHGIYVPQGLIGEVARGAGMRIVNYNPAFRKRCYIFSHNDTYHHTLISEPASAWEGLDLTPQQERQLMEYLQSRWYGTHDWIRFHRDPHVDVAAIERATGVDFTKPCIGMLTNVMWDAQLHYPVNAFPNMLDWVAQTIRYFAGRPDLQLLIRVHPAELNGLLRSRQPLVPEIRKLFPTLPPNVFIIPPESALSTYAAMSRCDSVLIYGTKTGVELTSVGIPVIVAGEAWIRGKGLTLDATSPAQYRELLDRLPLRARLDGEQLRRARRYAYHFFFRRMIPVGVIEPTRGNPMFRVTVKHVAELERGKSLGLDVICDGILRGTEFIYPAESVG